MKHVICVATAVFSLTACAALPSGGRVVDARDDRNRSEAFDEPYIRIIAAPPEDGWEPIDVVRGFTRAMANFDHNHRTMKEYLAPDVTFEPGPRPQVVVLDDAKPPTFSVSAAASKTSTTVQMIGNKVGSIDRYGQYTSNDEKGSIENFQLKQVAPGKWRIAVSPGQLFLLRSDVERAFRTTNRYFLAPPVPSATQVLVPDSVFLPLVNRSDLPTQVVQSLLAGPTKWLENAVVGSFPKGTKLLGDKVKVSEDGVATVNLSREAKGGKVDDMSAQLMWTLKQLPEVQKLKLEIDGRAQRPYDGSEVQEQKLWDALGPDSPERILGGQQFMLDASGTLSTLSEVDGKAMAVPVPHLEGRRLSRPAVSLNGKMVAGIRDKSLLVGPRDSGALVEVRKAGPKSSFLAPSWDRSGNLWVVESNGDKDKLWMLPSGGSEAVDITWQFGSDKFKALRIARDGVRAAALTSSGSGTKTEIKIGRIERSAGGVRLGDFRSINAELTRVTDLAWRDADTLAVLGRTATSTSDLPYEVPIAGGAVQAVSGGFGGEAKTISAAPGAPILLGIEIPPTAKQGKSMQVCVQKSFEDPRLSTWACAIEGKDPTYPG